MYHRWARWIALATIPMLICVALNPVNSGLWRLLTLVAIIGITLSLLLLTWKWPVPRTIVLLLIGVSITPLGLPTRPVDAIALRNQYIKQIKQLSDTRYHWGGEAAHGIDCSGLPRLALQQAMIHQGLKTLNGGLIRRAVSHWWFDAAADALANGYHNYAVPLNLEGDIHTMGYSRLEPGDFAVTADGVHLLVYLGDEEWIQADPGLGKVVILNGRTDPNQWFHRLVTLHRWTVLDNIRL